MKIIQHKHNSFQHLEKVPVGTTLLQGFAFLGTMRDGLGAGHKSLATGVCVVVLIFIFQLIFGQQCGRN